MANFSLAFLLKRLTRIAFFVICLFILFQVYFSLFLFRHTQNIINNIDESLGKIYISGVSFDCINGITFKNISVIDNSLQPQLLFRAKSLSLGFHPFDLFLKELNFTRLKTRRADVYLGEGFETFSKLSKIVQAVYDEFLKSQILPLEVYFRNPAIITRDVDFIFVGRSFNQEEIWLVKLEGRSFFRKNELYSKGALHLEHKFPIDSRFFEFFKNHLVSQSLDYEFLANFTDTDFIIERFDVVLGYDYLHGQAILKDINTRQPLLNLIVNPTNLSIENISSLVKDFRTLGTFNLSLVVRGPIDDLKFRIALNFLGCSFHYPPLPLLRNIVGKVYWTRESLKVEDVFSIVNDIPLKINSEISQKKNTTKFSFDLTIEETKRQIAFLPNSIKTELYYKKKDNTLSGDAKFIFKSKDEDEYSLEIKGFRFASLKDRGRLLAKEAVLAISPGAVKKTEDALKKVLNFSPLSADFDFGKKDFSIKNVQISGFRGQVIGDFNIIASPIHKYAFYLHAQGLNSAKIHDSLKLPYNLLGDISAKIMARSGEGEFAKGVLLIENGKLQETAVLLGLSKYMNIGSLKAIDFDKMQLNFSFLEGGIFRYGLKSWGKDALLKANIKIKADKQVSGYFSVQLSQKILAESANFRRLLKIIGPESSFVDFPFTLGGTIHTPRLIWLRNDFKRSLERRIPDWYKRGIERDIDTIIQEMFREGQMKP